MGVELTQVSREAPPAVNTNPDHDDASDTLDALDSIFNGNAPNESEPDGGVDEDIAVEGGEESDPDADDDAGQEGEETQGDEDAGDDKPSDEPEEDIQPESHDDDSSLELKPPTEEHFAEVEREFNQALAQIDPWINSQFGQHKEQIINEAKSVKSKMDALIKEHTNEDGYELPMVASKVLELQRLEKRAGELTDLARNLDNAERQARDRAATEIKIQSNLKLWPQFKKYEAELRKCVQSGMDISDPRITYIACRNLRGDLPLQPATPEPKKPEVPKAEIEKQALQESLTRKQKGAVSAGAKASGRTQKPTPAVPESLKQEMAEFSKYFRGDDE